LSDISTDFKTTVGLYYTAIKRHYYKLHRTSDDERCGCNVKCSQNTDNYRSTLMRWQRDCKHAGVSCLL